MKKPPIWQNRLYRGDCLEVMRRLHSEGIAPDLIYLDPPFNSNRNYHIIFRGGGKGAQQVAFSDMWEKAYREETERDITAVAADIGVDDRIIKMLQAWKEILGAGRADEKGLFNYLLYMTPRLLWCQKILSPRGGIYLHCDPTASHYLKAIMDLLFGRANFLNEIVWCYRKWTNAANSFQKNHDVLLAYSKSGGGRTFNKLFDAETAARPHYVRGYTTNRIKGVTQLLVYDKEKAARKIKEGKYDRVVYREGRTLTAFPDWWEIPIINSQSAERMGFSTQKPIALLERIVRASSNEDDLVFDPFCGCGTSINAAHNLKRKWIGADISLDAVKHIQSRARQRMLAAAGKDYDLIECGAQTPEEYERLSPYEKQEWLVRKVGGVCGPRGGDGGVDGAIRYHKGGEGWDFGEFVISVKTGGQANPGMLDQLRGAMEKRGAKMGGLILDREPTRGMLDAARKSPKIKHKMKIMGEMHTIGEFPSVQILTSAEIFSGEKFATPPTLMEKKIATGDKTRG